MFLSFSIGFKTSWLTQCEMVDLLACLKSISPHILVPIWNHKKKANFILGWLVSDLNWSHNLFWIHLRNIWKTKKNLKSDLNRRLIFWWLDLDLPKIVFYQVDLNISLGLENWGVYRIGILKVLLTYSYLVN